MWGGQPQQPWAAQQWPGQMQPPMPQQSPQQSHAQHWQQASHPAPQWQQQQQVAPPQQAQAQAPPQSAGSASAPETENIQVIVRVRPLNDAERARVARFATVAGLCRWVTRPCVPRASPARGGSGALPPGGDDERMGREGRS